MRVKFQESKVNSECYLSLEYTREKVNVPVGKGKSDIYIYVEIQSKDRYFQKLE